MKNILSIAADLLDIASDKASNAVCNDYYLKDTPENRELVLAMQIEQDPEDTELCIAQNGDILTFDHVLMSYLAGQLSFISLVIEIKQERKPNDSV